MARKYVIDTSSLFNFFRYLYFDKKSGAKIYKSLTDFLVSKINEGEIIIIDKVDVEMNGYPDYIARRGEFRAKLVDTVPLSQRVLRLSEKYYIAENEEKYFKNGQGQIDANRVDAELNEYTNKNADLFLVAKCLEIKDLGDEPILITSETPNTRRYMKLIQKIPTICSGEGIRCEDISGLIFERYKKELKFDLAVASGQQNQPTNAQPSPPASH